MIYLIGGPLKSGKTLIANKIKDVKNLSVFSTDFLLYGLGGENGMFSYYDSDEFVASKLEPMLIKIISFLVKNEEDYIIEGTHITLNLCEKLNALFKNCIKVVFLGYSTTTRDDKYKEIISNEGNIKNKWYNNISKNEFESLLGDKIIESKVLKNECKNKGYHYFDVINVDEVTEEVKEIFFGM